MPWISRQIKSKAFLAGIAIYTLVSVWFYWGTFWSQIVHDRSQAGWEVTGEIRASEWGIEQVLGKLDRGENPFSRINNIMYPYGVDIVASDPGLAFLVAPWRHFFSIHQAVILVVVFGMIGAGGGMYLLLSEMGLPPLAAFVGGLAYENNTFLLPRMGHVGFLASFWLFPWFFWGWWKFWKSSRGLTKIGYTLFLATLYLASLWINFYYFVILNLGIGMLLLYYLLTQPKLVWQTVRNNFWYGLLAINTLILLGWTWINTLWSTLKFSEVAKPQGWGGAIEFSSDLFNVLIPSAYNYYYGEVISKMAKHVNLMRGIFEDYNYPGLLIIFGMIALTYLLYTKRSQVVGKMLPYYLAASGFWVLTLGPFLQVAGRMYLQMEEDIRVVIPLPFALLHYLPYFNNLRVPGRLAMGLVFFGLIAVVILLDYLVKKLPKERRWWGWGIIIALIVFDQRPARIELESVVPNYPARLYQSIKADPAPSAVLLLPFTVRDGLTWFGDSNAVNIDYVQTYLGKPIIGGYVGRIPDYVKEYYRSNAFVGTLGRMIDPDLSTNPFMLNMPERDPWVEKLAQAREAANFLGIKYIVLTKTANSGEVEQYLKLVGYHEVDQEGDYLLLRREITPRDYTQLQLGAEGDNLQLGMGWWSREDGFRWSRKKSSVLVKNTQAGTYRLRVEGESLEPQLLTMYIDEVQIGQVRLGTQTETVASGSMTLSPGIHIVHLLFAQEAKPAEIFSGNLDARELAGKIHTISLERTE